MLDNIHHNLFCGRTNFQIAYIATGLLYGVVQALCMFPDRC